MTHSGKIGKFLHDYLYQWIDELDELYTKLLTETLLYRTITMDTIMNSCTNTDIHKRGVLERIVEPPL